MTPYYEKSGITIYHGDCREVLPRLSAESVDVVIADPPYAIDNKFGTQVGRPGYGNRSLQFAWDKAEGVAEGVAEAMRLCKAPFAAFCFVGLPTCELVRRAMLEAGLIVKMAAWAKECPAPALPGNWWPSAFELALYGYQSGAFFADVRPTRRNWWVHDSYRFGQPGKVAHPTQKPLSLIAYIMSAMAKPGSIILDPFMGSGTTLRAAKDAGCRAIGIEIEERYAEIAARRLEQSVIEWGDEKQRTDLQSSVLEAMGNQESPISQAELF